MRMRGPCRLSGSRRAPSGAVSVAWDGPSQPRSCRAVDAEVRYELSTKR
jgi:hypothetical protein